MLHSANHKTPKIFAVLLCYALSSQYVVAQAPVDQADFLTRYRAAVPKLENALYRNKHIVCDIIHYNGKIGADSKPEAIIKNAFRSNNDRFLLEENFPDGRHFIRILRPDHLYIAGNIAENKSVGPIKIISDRQIPEAASEVLTQSGWWGHPHCGTNEGLGHGLVCILSETSSDWYTWFANGSLPIDTVTETIEQRPAYCVTTRASEAFGTKAATFWFDKSNFMMFKANFNPVSVTAPNVYRQYIVDYDMKPDDYSTLVVKNCKISSVASDNRRILHTEYTFPVYKTATHPPETFRLEQFGLPDVAERPRATSRRSIGFVIAGVALGVLLLVAWLRGRRAKTA